MRKKGNMFGPGFLRARKRNQTKAIREDRKMRKILLFAVIMALAMTGTGHAIDFQVKGSWQFAFDYIDGGNFMGKYRDGHKTVGNQWAAVRQQRDNFEAIQRLHLQLHARASENLSGVVFFEIGETRWGLASQGGALGSDGKIVKVKQAYIDWAIPDSGIKIRMGLQGFALPSFAVATPVLQDDVAAITANWKMTDNVSLTAFWLRLLNDNYVDENNASHNGFLDNFDLFGLTIPFNFDGLQITPWGMGGAMGPNTLPHPMTQRPGRDGSFNYVLNSVGAPITDQPIDGRELRDGLYPAAFTTGRARGKVFSDEYSSMWWAGLTGKWTGLDPFRLSFDFTYGSVDHNRAYLRRQGWYGMLVAEYAFDWGVPGLYGWYFSGDDDDPHNGSERMPYLATTNNVANSLSTFGFRGNPIMGGGKGEINVNPTGTWGIGARIRELSFIEKLSHTVLVNFYSGSNSPAMAKYITGAKSPDNGRTLYRNNSDFNSFGTYLTTLDTGLEVNVDTKYKMYDNLTLYLELGYIHLWLDKGTWGKFENLAGNTLNQKDAWKASLNFVYNF